MLKLVAPMPNVESTDICGVLAAFIGFNLLKQGLSFSLLMASWLLFGLYDLNSYITTYICYLILVYDCLCLLLRSQEKT